jgi:SulP family sulfate permease
MEPPATVTGRGRFSRGLAASLAGGLAALPAGGLIALVTLTYTMSYAALIFSGGLAPAYPTGLACLLVGCAVAGVATALRSSIPFAVSAPDSNVVAILAVAMAPLPGQLAAGSEPAALAATALMAVVLLSLGTGLALGLLGLLRAGRLVRFVPYPVIAGFLGASGWLMLAGGVRVAGGVAGLLDPSRLAPVLAALGGGAALSVALARQRGPLGLPLLVLAGALLHHAVAAWLGLGIAAQQAAGWLSPMPGRLAFVLPWDPAILALVDWPALARHLADLPLLILIATIALLVQVSGVETGSRRDAEIDRELRVAGGAALATGLAGGLFGLISTGRTLLLLQAGGPGRAAGIAAGLLAAGLPLLAPDLLGLLPRWVLGGLLVSLGLGMLRQWLLDSRRHLPLSEWLQVLAVAGLTVGLGFVIGLLAGLLLACGQFITGYGRVSPLRARYDGTAAEGNRARSAQDREVLRSTGTARLILHLQGFLFFGTANRLLELVRAELAGPEPRTHLLLDFHEVVGLDSSAGMAFTRLHQFAAARGVRLVLSGLSAGVARGLGPLAADPSIRRLPRLQDGIEWMEEDALAALPPLPPPPTFATRLATLMGEADAARFLAALPMEEVPPGTVLMVQDEASDDVVLLEEGRVTIGIRLASGYAITVRVEGPGALIGELGFLLGTPRTATVTTETPCRLRRMDRAGLARLEREAPDLGIWFHRLLGQMLAGRIQDKDRMIHGLLRGLSPPEAADKT